MKVCIIITVKLIFIALAVFLVNDPAQQLKTYTADYFCLNVESNNTLCAQCFKRDSNILPKKGYHVKDTAVTSVLKIEQTEKYLNCNEYLQMIDYEKDYRHGQLFHLQNLVSIQQILAEMKGILTFQNQTYGQSEYIVEPQYNQFVVYKWWHSGKKQATVTSVNSAYYHEVNNYLLYGFNFILLVVLVAWLGDNSFFSDLRTPVKISVIVIAICVQLALLGIWKNLAVFVARVFVLNLGLFKMKVNNLKVISYMLAGALMSYFPFTLLIYTGLMTILVAYYGKDQSETSSAKTFLVIFYTIFLLNYSYWYQYVMYLNDIPSLIIEFSILTFIPTGIFLLPNAKEFRRYTPSDPEVRAISLSGFDEDQETNI